ncbi:MAG TPA: hypothetical protein VK927_08500, partial [Adhaeribacter sp.]|nr:hypothetical protein [Adhaeribacter sp.]
RGLVLGYQQLDAVQAATAKVVFGQLKPRGMLPVTVNSHYPYGAGITRYQLVSKTAGNGNKTVGKTTKKVTPASLKKKAAAKRKK